MKSIVAVKCKNNWFVSIMDARTMTTESDVLALIRQEGMKVKKQYSKEGRIYADSSSHQ